MTVDVSSGSSANLDAVKSLVEEKENEWKQANALRVELIEAKYDKLRAEADSEREKLEALKADFTYNLVLLQERDAELGKAEEMVSDLRKGIFEKDAVINELQATGNALKSQLSAEFSRHQQVVEQIREECSRQLKEYVSQMSVQQTEQQAERDLLHQRVGEIEARYAAAQQQLEVNFREELLRFQRDSDSRVEDLRSRLATAEAETKLLVCELDRTSASERRKNVELAAAEKALEDMKEELRRLKISASDGASRAAADISALEGKVELLETLRIQQGKRHADEIGEIISRLERSEMVKEEVARKSLSLQMQLSALSDPSSSAQSAELGHDASLLRVDLEQCRAELAAVRQTNNELSEKLLRSSGSNTERKKLAAELDAARRDFALIKEKEVRSNTAVQKLQQQNAGLKEVIRQMKDEVESMLAVEHRKLTPSHSASTQTMVSQQQHATSQTTQTAVENDSELDTAAVVEEDESNRRALAMAAALAAGSESLRDPRVRRYIDTLLERNANLQHRVVELVAEVRRQAIRVDSTLAQLESVELDAGRLRASLEQARYESSVEKTRHDTTLQAVNRRLNQVEQQLSEARAMADSYHAAATDAQHELEELRQRLARRDLDFDVGQKRPPGQELYIQQLEDQISELGARRQRLQPINGGKKSTDDLEARLGRAIAMVVQLQRDRQRLLDMSARLRSEKKSDTDRRHESASPTPTSSSLGDDNDHPLAERPHSAQNPTSLDELERREYFRVREMLSSAASRDADSLPSSRAIQNVFRPLEVGSPGPDTQQLSSRKAPLAAILSRGNRRNPSTARRGGPRRPVPPTGIVIPRISPQRQRPK